jgi:hypothetical protein
LSILREQTKKIKTTCPICEKKETILISLLELDRAQKNHSLITKAIPHFKDGHVLTIYIDGEGIVRRKYCFDLVQNNIIKIDEISSRNLDSVFDKMLQDSLKR